MSNAQDLAKVLEPDGDMFIDGTWRTSSRDDSTQYIQSFFEANADYSRLDLSGGSDIGSGTHYFISYGDAHEQAGDLAIKNNYGGEIGVYSGTSNLRRFRVKGDGQSNFFQKVGIGRSDTASVDAVLHLETGGTIGAPNAPSLSNAALKITDQSVSMYFDGNAIMSDTSGTFEIGNTHSSGEVRMFSGGSLALTLHNDQNLDPVGDIEMNTVGQTIWFGQGSGQVAYIKHGSVSGSIGQLTIASDSAIDFVETDDDERRIYMTLNDGGFYAASLNTTSDERVKTNIETLTSALDTASKLRGVTYERVDHHSSVENILEAGVVAQEVQEHFPIAVKAQDDEDQTLSVNYNCLIALLIESTKELKEKNEQLEARIAALEAQ